jgi:DNA-binding LytR/AlgR family response regulator
VTFLELKDLDWISAAGVYLHLHIGGKTHLYRSSISAFLQRLDPHRFVRIHRSTVVNTGRIRELRPRGFVDLRVEFGCRPNGRAANTALPNAVGGSSR